MLHCTASARISTIKNKKFVDLKENNHFPKCQCYFVREGKEGISFTSSYNSLLANTTRNL